MQLCISSWHQPLTSAFDISSWSVSIWHWPLILSVYICLDTRAEYLLAWWTYLLAVPICWQFLPAGSTLLRHYLPAGSAYLQAVSSCWQYLPAGNTYLQAVPSCRQYIPAGSTFLQAVPFCRQYLPAGSTYLQVVASCWQYLPAGSTSAALTVTARIFFQVLRWLDVINYFYALISAFFSYLINNKNAQFFHVKVYFLVFPHFLLVYFKYILTLQVYFKQFAQLQLIITPSTCLTQCTAPLHNNWA